MSTLITYTYMKICWPNFSHMHTWATKYTCSKLHQSIELQNAQNV